MILLTPLLWYQANPNIIPTTNFLNSILNNQQNIGESEEKKSVHLKDAVSRETLKQELIAKAFAHILENNLIAKANEVVLSEGKLRVSSRCERVPLLDFSQFLPHCVQLATALGLNPEAMMEKEHLVMPTDYENLIEMERQQQNLKNKSQNNVSV